MCALIAEGNRDGSMKRILLIEDEDSIRKLAVRFLEKLGYEALVADSPEEALALMDGDTSEITAIITDVMLPRIDGRQLIARIREQNPAIKALFVSGYSAEDVGVAGKLGPNEAFAQKPFTCEGLGESLSSLLAD
ncbi:MAG: response regulator [Spartobacteria bacterium]|nr:response regulator [Spartobacteria bacterium]